VNQIYRAAASNITFSHLMYNDDPPNATAASSVYVIIIISIIITTTTTTTTIIITTIIIIFIITRYAHAKGVLACNATNGFWLVHSVPNWPYSLSVGYLPYPYAAQGIYAQSFICVSMNTSTTNSVGASLLKMRPKYYSSSLPPSLLPLLPAINAALLSTVPINTPPLAITVSLYSLGIASPPRLFTSFAKTASWNQDIWADFVAPTLNSSLFMEGWVNGVGAYHIP